MIIPQLAEPEFQALAERCAFDTRMFAQVFMGDIFDLPFSPVHDEIFRIFDDDEIQKAAIAAPRGWGKTSLCRAFEARHICYQSKDYIIPISKTATQAEEQSENLKFELQSNAMIRRIFGNIKAKVARGDQFSKTAWVTDTGIKVLPRGAGQQIRGTNHRGKRPDLILFDDFEDSEEVQNEELRRKNRNWFSSDARFAVQDYRKDWRILVVGTILHEDSLLQNLLEDDDWYSVRLEACDDDLNSNWPEVITNEHILKLREEFKRSGLLDIFYREYRNIPISLEDAVFQPSYFRYYDEVNEKLDSNEHVENVVLVDPAKTVKLHSADSAIVGVAIDRVNNAMYVRDIVAGKMHPDELYDNILKMGVRLGAYTIGVEVTSLNEFITYPLKNAIQQSGRFFELVELKARAKKEERIAALAPFYRRGLIFHNPHVCPVLEEQLIAFPRARRWDVMDAFAYIVELLDLGGRFFAPADDAWEEELERLDREAEDSTGNWRYAP